MVKNTKGGKGAKSIARKSSSHSSSSSLLPTPSSQLELIGFVSKIFGNCMFQISFHDGSSLIGHIRGKFRGRNKRNNLLKLFDVVLVGLRELENPLKNCDLLFIYDDNDVRNLLDFPNLFIHKLLLLIPNPSNLNSSTNSFDQLDLDLFSHTTIPNPPTNHTPYHTPDNNPLPNQPLDNNPHDIDFDDI